MTHANSEEWARYLEGELTQARAAELDRHRLECTECSAAFAEAEALFADLRQTPPELLEMDLLPAIQAKLSAPRRSRRWIAAPLALAAGLALFALVPLYQPDEIRAKSAAVATADAWVGLEAFTLGSGDGLRALRNDPIAARDELAFAYRNIGSSPFGYLMIFARGSDGEIYWYYPAYTDASSDPRSIAIQTGVFDLPDRIAHHLPPGSLFFYGLFTRTPRSVKEIEALARSIGAGDRLPIEDSGQHVLRAEVAR